MMVDFRLSAEAVDSAAAAVLAAAIGFAAFGLGTAMLAMVVAPLGFVVTSTVLGRVDGGPLYRLAEFDLQAFDRPRRSAATAPGEGNVVQLFDRSDTNPSDAAADLAAVDARHALSDALARLKQSLR